MIIPRTILLFSICGLIPFFNQAYGLIFASRFIFGLGARDDKPSSNYDY